MGQATQLSYMMARVADISADLTQWRKWISKSFPGLEITSTEPNFHASADYARLGDVELFAMHTDAHHVRRRTTLNTTPGTLGASNTPGAPTTALCKLSLQITGHTLLTQDSRSCCLQPGDLALYVAHRPYEIDYPGAQHSLVMLFPESYLHLSPGQLAEITAVPISRDHGLGRVAIPLFEELTKNIEVLAGPHAHALVRSALNMVVTVLHEQVSSQRGGPAAGTLLFQRAVDHIAQHLHDPELTPTTLANHLFVSVRHVHSLFSDHGLTVAAYIRQQRLLHIHQDLADPRYAQDTVQSISRRYGLHDPSYVSKAFRAEFHESPREYRGRVLGRASSS